MAADSDGSGDDSLTTVVTCEGDLNDPDFPTKFNILLDELQTILCPVTSTDAAAAASALSSATSVPLRSRLRVRKLEPWNSVRVTLTVPRDAALRLRQLAAEGSSQLRALGILSVQVEGDQVISLRLAGRFGQESHEIVLRTGGAQDGATVASGTDDNNVVSGLTRIIAGGPTTSTAATQSHPSTSSSSLLSSSSSSSSSTSSSSSSSLPSTPSASTAVTAAPQLEPTVQFRSPNVVCPTDTQVPKPPPPVITQTSAASTTASGTNAQRNYNGPFPFASMTHAAQTIHGRENAAAAVAAAAAAAAASASASTSAFTQPPPPPPPPPPPYPSQSSSVVGAIKTGMNPNVAMSSPLLVNLLQNDGQQPSTPAKMLPPQTAVTTVTSMTIEQRKLIATSSPSSSTSVTPQQTIVKTEPIGYNTVVPTPSSIQPMQQPQLVRPPPPPSPQVASRFIPQTVQTQPKQVPPPIRPPLVQQQQQQQQQVRPVRPPATIPVPTTVPVPATVPVAGQKLAISLNTQIPRQPSYRGQSNQFSLQQQQQQQQPQQHFPSPPPYPSQRPAGVYNQDLLRYQPLQQQQQLQQQRLQIQQSQNWPQQQQQQQQLQQPPPPPVPQPAPQQFQQKLDQIVQPITQPIAHLSTLLESSLSNITPSLTDLSKTDLDSLLEGELDSDIPDIPDSLTTGGKRRQYLINPLTGILELMPSDSGSDTESEQTPIDIFNNYNSPLNDRSNSIYSDDDTCSTTISRSKFDTTDQSDSETTIKSTNSDNSVKSHVRLKTAKNRDRNRESPGLKKPEKIKLRLKLEKSEPVSPAYKVDVSFIQQQQPKRAMQQQSQQQTNVARIGATPLSSVVEELRVPPLHISLRGRNSVVINSEKKKKYTKLNADGSVDVKKSKKLTDGFKLKKSPSATSVISTNTTTTTTTASTISTTCSDISSSSSSFSIAITTTATTSEMETSDTPITSTMNSVDGTTPTHISGSEHKLTTTSNLNVKPMMKVNDLDDLPLNYRLKEPGEIVPVASPRPVKNKKSKLNHLDHREQNLLAGGHLVDDYKTHKKLKSEEKLHKSGDSKLSYHMKKEKFKERMSPGHIGEMRRGSDSDVIKGLKRHADSNGLSHSEKKRRLSQSEGKMNAPTLTESQGVNKSVKLKSSSTTDCLPQPNALVHQTVVGSTNVGTIGTIAQQKSLANSKTFTNDDKLEKTILKQRQRNDKDAVSFLKTKSNSLKTKDLNREKTYAQNVAEKLAKQLPLPIGEIDMEAKFKQSLLETEMPRRYQVKQQQQQSETIVTTTTTTANSIETVLPVETNKKDSPDRKSTETEQTQHSSSRSPNGGGQGEDSGIESMDALSEKSPNQASQSPHSHTDITLTDQTVSDMKLVKTEPKLENCLPDLLDIEEQLAKMDGLPTLNGDLSHRIKTEPFIKTETLIEKLEGTEGKDLNENKEHITEPMLENCCHDLKVKVTQQQIDTKIDIKKEDSECKVMESGGMKTDKEMDFDPLPIRRKPPLYTYSNPDKSRGDSLESPIPNLSDLEEYENSDSNSECSETKLKQKQTRRRKPNLEQIELHTAYMEDHYLNDLTGFKKNEIVKKTPKSLLEQLLIEIPTELTEKQSSISPSVSEKSKSSIRTRSSSKLNSPDLEPQQKCDKLKTPRHSPVITKQQESPTLCTGSGATGTTTTTVTVTSLKTSPKSAKSTVPGKRKRQESESSTQSVDETGTGLVRNKKTRKCSENAVELIKACMGVETADNNNKNLTIKSSVLKESKKLLRKTQLVDLESSDSDEPLIEVAGKVRNKHAATAATRNKLQNSTKTTLLKSSAAPPSSAMAAATVVPGANRLQTGSDEKTVGTRRSVRNNALLKTRSKQLKQQPQQLHNHQQQQQQQQHHHHQQQQHTNSQVVPVDKITSGSGSVGTVLAASNETDANRRKTRSTVTDDSKRRRNSRDSK